MKNKLYDFLLHYHILQCSENLKFKLCLLNISFVKIGAVFWLETITFFAPLRILKYQD